MAFVTKYLPKIEHDIALLLIRKTYDQKLDKSSCSKIAKQVLELLPKNIDLELLEETLPKLKEVYWEFSPIGLKYLNLINNKKSKEEIDEIKQKINNILYGANK